ncbi:MAG: putative metal-binding motif-containing protein [Sandaracinaceae bacterium]
MSTLCCNGAQCGDDCDDTRIAVNPGAGEICNEVDDDCNGMIDEGVLLTFYRDVDGDNFGDDTMTTLGCSATVGFTVAPGDCDDMSAARNPGNPEDRAVQHAAVRRWRERHVPRAGV